MSDRAPVPTVGGGGPLVTTDGGASTALFDATDGGPLGPGEVRVTCTTVRAAAPGWMAFGVVDVAGALADDLLVTVERLSDGGGPCEDRDAATVVHAGTLADAPSGGAGPWRTEGGASTYRFSVRLDGDASQGATVSATFVWTLTT